MKHIWRLAAVLVAMVLAASACGGGGSPQKHQAPNSTSAGSGGTSF